MSHPSRWMIPADITSLKPIPTPQRTFTERCRHLGRMVCPLSNEQFDTLYALLNKHHTDGLTDGETVYTIAGHKDWYSLFEYHIQ